MPKADRSNGHVNERNPDPRRVSRLGQRLRELSDKALASGTRTLSTEQIHKLIAEVRGRPN